MELPHLSRGAASSELACDAREGVIHPGDACNIDRYSERGHCGCHPNKFSCEEAFILTIAAFQTEIFLKHSSIATKRNNFIRAHKRVHPGSEFTFAASLPFES